MAGPITISVIGDTRSLVGGLDTAGKGLGKLGEKAGRTGKAIAKGLAVGVAGLTAATGAFLATSLTSLARIERIGAQTDSVIRSTGGAARVTRAHVDELAGTLENLTATEAESITEGANMLLTFTNIKNGVGESNQIFDQAVTAITDMSRAFDKTGSATVDTTKTAIQLGKALNDPIKGVTALSKVGVSFTQQQRDQIKTLVDSGKTMEAQKIILAELNKEFGGAGEAFGGTTVGKIELAKHALGTLGESLATNLLPPLGFLATQATKGLAWLDTKAPAIRAFAAGVLEDLKPALEAAGSVVGVVGAAIAAAAPDFLEAARAVGDYLGPALASFVPYLRDVGDALVTEVLPAAKDLGRSLKTSLGPVLADLGDLLIGDVLPALQDIGLYIYREVIPAGLRLVGTLATYLGPALAAIIDVVRAAGVVFVRDLLPPAQQLAGYLATTLGPILSSLGDLFVTKVLPTLKSFATFVIGTLVPIVVDVATKVGAKLKPVIDALAETFRSSVMPTITKVITKFEEWRPTIQAVIVVVAKVVGKVLELAAAILGKVLPPLIRFAGFMLRNVVPAVLGVIGVIVKVIGKAVEFGRAFVNTLTSLAKWVTGVTSKGREVVSYTAGIPGKITKALGDLGGLLLEKGKALIQGFLNGVKQKGEELVNYVKGLPGRVAGSLGDIGGKIGGLINKAGGILGRGAVSVTARLSRALLSSLQNGEKGLTKYLDGLSDRLSVRIAKAYRIRETAKLTAAQVKAGKKITDAQVNAYTKKRLAEFTKGVSVQINVLRKAAKAYAADLKARKEYAAGVRDTALATANITQVGQVGENGQQTAASITQGLRDRLNAIVNFNRKVKELAKAGLRKDLLEQIIAQGPEGGIATAEALAAGGADAIRQANYLQQQIKGAAQDLGVTAANAVLKPLDKDKVIRAANAAAAQIAKVIRKLGIRVDLVANTSGNRSGGRRRTTTRPAPRLGIENTTGRRTRVSDDAVSRRTDPQRFRIELTAEQLSAIERGRRVTADVRAYKKAGGK